MRRIGLYGGSFNPPHEAHLAMPRHAYEQIGLEEVWMLVTPRNPHKDPAKYAELEHRIAMSTILTAGEDWIKPTDIEKHFSTTNTADTLTLLTEIYPDIEPVWIMGADNFATFHKWNREAHQIDGNLVPDWQYLLHKFSLAVLVRPGDGEQALDGEIAQTTNHLRVHDPEQLAREQKGWSLIQNPPMDVSSSQILKDLIAGKDKVPGLTPEVLDYLTTHVLYEMKGIFNHVALKNRIVPQPPNYVPIESMIALARMAHVIKSIGTLSSDEVVHYFETCWKKSEAKGDFEKREDVPGEIADCVISLQWLASLQDIELDDITDAKEIQNSVSSWCDEHYPGENLRQRTLNLIEELAELLCCQGLEYERGSAILQHVFEYSFTQDLNVSYRQSIKALEAYTLALGDGMANVLDSKMQLNRARTTEESAQRLEHKQGAIQLVDQQPH